MNANERARQGYRESTSLVKRAAQWVSAKRAHAAALIIVAVIAAVVLIAI